MTSQCLASSLGLLLLIVAEAPGQTSAPPTGQPTAPGLRPLTGDDARRAGELDKAVEAALKADRWDEAIARAEELLALRARVQGPKHFEAVTAEWRLEALRRVAPMPKEDRVAFQSIREMYEQAQALHAQGKYAQAQPLYEKALEVHRRLLTDEHPDSARISDSLATTLRVQGKYALARSLSEKALEIHRRRLGDDHPDTATNYNNLALILGHQGKRAEARPLLEKALEIHRRLLGDDHPATATNYNNLAGNLRDQGKYAEAQPLYEKALEIHRRRLGDDHPDTAINYNNLAMNLDAQGRYADAQPLLEKSLDIRRRRLGDDHPDTARGYNNLALNLDAQGKYVQAQSLYEKALEVRRRRLGEDHPDTARGYNNLALNLDHQGKYADARPLFEKALEIHRRRLGEDHPLTALSYNNLAVNLNEQGKYELARPLYEKALDVRRRRLGEDHPLTALSYNNLAASLGDQGKYREARDLYLSAVKSLDAARLRIAFAGLERGGSVPTMRPALADVQARLGRPTDAWQALEEDLGRGLLDELAARRDQRLTAAERERLRELTVELERLDQLVETTPQGLDQAGRAKRFEDLKRRRELASIALGEFQTGLVRDHGPLAGRVAGLDEIQAALPADTALVAWVDLKRRGPYAADPDRGHWGVVVRSCGIPAWVPIAGTGPDGRWTEDDRTLGGRIRTELRRRPGGSPADLRPLLERLRTQRLEPLAPALGATTDGQPPARRLIVLPSFSMAGIPVEAFLAPDDSRTVSYAPSATVFKYLREQPRPDRQAGLLALGDPVYQRADASSETGPPPDHGLLVDVVAPGSNAATHGLKPGDVLLAYNGAPLRRREDFKAAPEPGQPIPVDLWRDGRSTRRELAPGRLGVAFDPRPAPEAIAAKRKMNRVLAAARSGDGDFPPLPGTRYEVEALARLFGSNNRPTRTLLGADASEPELDRLAASGELGRFAFIHLATHGVIDEAVPARSAVILTQTGLPDPLEQSLGHRPVFDGRLSVREIQRSWALKAELVTLSACETALGREAVGEGFVGFTQALLMSGTRSLVLSQWKVDDRATALLMARFYQDLMGKRPDLSRPMPKAEALREAKQWLRDLTADEVGSECVALDRGPVRPLAQDSGGAAQGGSPSAKPGGIRPYAHPYYWAAFILLGDPD